MSNLTNGLMPKMSDFAAEVQNFEAKTQHGLLTIQRIKIIIFMCFSRLSCCFQNSKHSGYNNTSFKLMFTYITDGNA